MVLKGDLKMKEAYKPDLLPLKSGLIDNNYFLDELINSNARLAVYKEKLIDSKIDSQWVMPTLQKKEAIASTKLEGTQATLDGVLIHQIEPKEEDLNINEVNNYFNASIYGMKFLRSEDFSKEFFCDIHKTLMSGNIRMRENCKVGSYRTTQNFIGLVGDSHQITYVPPVPENVDKLMNNLIAYMNKPNDNLHPLVRTAIIHAQIETIHPFDDGNGRVGRIMIPLYLYAMGQISIPCFFISEALESDKFRYYTLLNDIREKNNWNEWIKFFLQTVAKQCDKYIYIIAKINDCYEEHLKKAKDVIKNNSVVDIINYIYQNPVFKANMVEQETGIPIATVNRYLNSLVKIRILYTNGKARNRIFFCYDLLDILRF